MSPLDSVWPQKSIVFLVLLFGVLAAGPPSDQHFGFRQVFEKSDIHDMLITDINNDGHDEYIIQVPQAGAKSAMRVYYYDFQRLYFQKNFKSDILRFITIPWRKSAAEQLVLIEKKERWINLLLIDSQNGDDTLAYMPLYQTRKYEADINISIPEIYDLNLDGYPEIFIPFSSGLEAELRAVWAVDIRNNQILWKYDVAPNIVHLEIVHPGKDGDPLLLVSNQSPNNGHRTTHMDDAHSYILIINAVTGKLTFLREAGGWPSYTQLRHTRGKNGTQLYAVSVDQTAQAENLGLIQIITLPDYTVKKNLSLFRVDEIIFTSDINNDGADEFLRSGHDNRIQVYDHELKPMDVYQLEGTRCRIELITDFDRNGFKEMLISVDGAFLFLTDHNGQIISHNNFTDGKIFEVRKDPDKGAHFGIFSPDNEVYVEWKIDPVSAMSRRQNTGFFWGIILGIVISGVIGLLVMVYRKKKTKFIRSSEIFNYVNVPGVVSDLGGNIVYINPRMKKILQLDSAILNEMHLDELLKKLNLNISLRDWIEKYDAESLEYDVQPDLYGNEKQYRARLRSIIREGRVIGMMLVMEDLTDKMRYDQSLAWIAMAQRMVHEIKNPLTTVKLSLQRLKMEYEKQPDKEKQIYDVYVDSVLEEVLRLRTVAENFLKYFKAEHPDYKTIDVCELLAEIIDNYKPKVSDQIEFVFNKKLLKCHLEADPTQIQIMITNLFDNAIHAIEGKGKLEIGIDKIDKFEDKGLRPYVLIEIEDNGRGIDKKSLENVFEPYISGDSDGTGLGLSIVKKIIESHEGTINISSKEGAGTLVSIELPVSHGNAFDE